MSEIELRNDVHLSDNENQNYLSDKSEANSVTMNLECVLH